MRSAREVSLLERVWSGAPGRPGAAGRSLAARPRQRLPGVHGLWPIRGDGCRLRGARGPEFTPRVRERKMTRYSPCHSPDFGITVVLGCVSRCNVSTRGRTRTGTALRPRDFKSHASTISPPGCDSAPRARIAPTASLACAPRLEPRREPRHRAADSRARIARRNVQRRREI